MEEFTFFYSVPAKYKTVVRSGISIERLGGVERKMYNMIIILYEATNFKNLFYGTKAPAAAPPELILVTLLEPRMIVVAYIERYTMVEVVHLLHDSGIGLVVVDAAVTR